MRIESNACPSGTQPTTVTEHAYEEIVIILTRKENQQVNIKARPMCEGAHQKEIAVLRCTSKKTLTDPSANMHPKTNKTITIIHTQIYH